VRRGNGWWKKVQYRQPAENSLEDHSGHRTQGKPAHPAALVDAPGPESDDDGQQPDKLSYHAVAMLELHSTDHPRHLVKRTKRRRPVRYRQACIVAGHQPAGNNEQESQPGNKDCKTMMSCVVGGKIQNCSLDN